MFNEICYFTIIIVQSNRRLQAKALSSDRLRNIIIIMIMIMIIIIIIIIIIIDNVTFSRPAVLYFFRLDKGSLRESQLKQLCGEFRQIADCRIQIQQVPKETICTFNTDLGNSDPFPSLYLFKESLTIQLIIGRFVHYFVMGFFVLVTSFTLKSLFYSFNRLFIHECWHRASISIHPSRPSVHPSIRLLPTHARTYPQFIIYRFAFKYSSDPFPTQHIPHV